MRGTAVGDGRRCSKREANLGLMTQLKRHTGRLGNDHRTKNTTTNRTAGTCHRENTSFELRTQTLPEYIQARACDCSFRQIHAAKN